MLRKEQRLTSSRDFETVYRRGRGYTHRLVVLKALRRDVPRPPRYGFSTSPKLGTVVARNRAKRQLREAVRSLLMDLKEAGFDAVLIGRPAMREASFAEIRDAVEELFRKAGLLSRSGRETAS